MTFTSRAEKWIADSGDDTEEFEKWWNEEGHSGTHIATMDEYYKAKAAFSASRANERGKSAEIMAGLMAEIERLRQDACHACISDVGTLELENAALKLQLSGRTYCHSDEAVEEENQRLRKALNKIEGLMPSINDTPNTQSRMR